MRSTFLLLPLLVGAPSPAAAQNVVERPNLDLARLAAQWIDAQGLDTEHGRVWPADAADPESVSFDLYAGTPGVVLFFSELHRAGAGEPWLERALAGGDHLVATLDEQLASLDTGLYTGTAGLGFALAALAEASGEERFRAAALRVVEDLHERASSAGEGVEWSPVTDVIAGNAGTGLFLLWAAEHLEHPKSLELAVSAGRRLVDVAEERKVGLGWKMSPDFERDMPNFSHGTAGVAYFLATLYGRTEDEAFRDAAIEGARHLLSIADVSNDGLRIYHHAPGGEELYYYGWCHGPTGTARLYQRLAEMQPEKRWDEWLRRAASSINATSLPEERTEGFWNNVGQCCGSAGVAQFLLDLHRGNSAQSYRELAGRFQADVIKRATKKEAGWSWPQAEHRSRPELLQAQTGYQQGAAGIGLMFLHFDAAETGRDGVVRLPDDPF